MSSFNGRDRDHSYRDLSKEIFRNLDLSGMRFHGTKLSSARFIHCHTCETAVDFTQADLRDATFEHCEFPEVKLDSARLDGATITDCRWHDAHLTGCSLDRTKIENLEIPRATLHLASFRDAATRDIQFMPAKSISLWSCMGYLCAGQEPRRGPGTVAGADATEFIFHCARQHRLERILAGLARKGLTGLRLYRNRAQRLIAAPLLLLLGVTSDFGTSLSRWFWSCLAIVLVSSLVIAHGPGAPPPYRLAALKSIEVFLNAVPASSFEGGVLPWVLLGEKCLGVFMLGSLVSILSLKYFPR